MATRYRITLPHEPLLRPHAKYWTGDSWTQDAAQARPYKTRNGAAIMADQLYRRQWHAGDAQVEPIPVDQPPAAQPSQPAQAQPLMPRSPLAPTHPVSPIPVAVIVQVMTDHRGPEGKVADAELHFPAGVLGGMKLIGFGVWERRNHSGCNVTFPARSYAVNGERRSFALLRPIDGPRETLRNVIIDAYEQHRDQPNDVSRWEYDAAGLRLPMAQLIAQAQAAQAQAPLSPVDQARARMRQIADQDDTRHAAASHTTTAPTEDPELPTLEAAITLPGTAPALETNQTIQELKNQQHQDEAQQPAQPVIGPALATRPTEPERIIHETITLPETHKQAAPALDVSSRLQGWNLAPQQPPVAPLAQAAQAMQTMPAETHPAILMSALRQGAQETRQPQAPKAPRARRF